ncbi:alpha-amylase family glycosyl hydrolase [Lysobacter sp. A3-1-A15]|uniref:alpha-amylase family glycosyl hydrolase n=1 Tax=Novilysobacter viscosus TaxID=3098602 RepID=UPI002EDA3281
MSLRRPRLLPVVVAVVLASALGACAHAPSSAGTAPPTQARYVGTDEPFAAHAVYFVVTDRFVNGDASNDQRDQGGRHRTFDRPLEPCDGVAGNVGYLGGDFRGIVDNLDYIRGMGFGAVWITPVVDNPDEAFTGGSEPGCGTMLSDRGKTGYHGYWGVDFFRLDEHLPSAGLDFRGLADAVHARDMKLVLDIVGNHGSPAYSMTHDQPKFGEVHGPDGSVIADHQNLHPTQLDPAGNPLHAFFNATGPVDGATGSIFDGNLAQLGDFDAANPAVLEYLAGAYEQWIDQGADAFRIDTIAWMPHAFWKAFTQRIRSRHPGFFMFGEAFDYDAAAIAAHTLPANGGVSVLDFPMKQAMDEVFGRKRVGFERLAPTLHLVDGPYANPYALATFYDNHDMARMDASDEGFIDAHHWLFTARGIPVVYYGSETGFMRGRAEHAGNRNYFGQARVDAAADHPIHQALTRIASVRRTTPALQRGVQLNVELAGDRAAFYRVLQDGDTAQVALVLLNKGDAPAAFAIDAMLQAGTWRAALSGVTRQVATGGTLTATVPAHGVEVWVRDGPVTEPALVAALEAVTGRD